MNKQPHFFRGKGLIPVENNILRGSVPRLMLVLLVFPILLILSCASAEEPVQTPAPEPIQTAPAPAPEPAPAPVLVPVSASSPPENPPPAPEPAPAPPVEVPALILEGARSHRVVWGDTLSSLAKRYYGSANGYYFPVIMLASDKVVFSPDVIIPGMILTIPDLNRNLENPQSRSKIKSLLRETADLYERKRDTRTRNNLIRLANSL